MGSSKKSKCALCDGIGLFPFCSKCLAIPRNAGYKVEEIDDSPYAGLPSYERKRREAIDKQRAISQERDLIQIKNNMLKCNQVSTGVPHLDQELFVLFGPREKWT